MTRCMCMVCDKQFDNSKSLSNHFRWHDLPQYEKFQESCRKNCSEHNMGKPWHGKNTGQNNGMWKGDDAGYGALHRFVTRHKPKTELCEDCNESPPYDLANISQEYKRDLDDWEWLCRRCHMIKDGRMNNLKQYGGVYSN